MKERMLMLARACPIVSQKYEYLVCIAGITESGDWRRIYPVQWKTFWGKNADKFKKKMWIEYELESNVPSDHRSESRKVKPNSVQPLYEEKYSVIRELLQSKLSSVEKLSLFNHKEVSLGVVQPQVNDFFWEKSEHYETLTEKQRQQTLFSGSAIKSFIPKQSFSYNFSCQNEPNCKNHRMICEDWELGELVRHCEDYCTKGKYKDEAEVLEKIKQKMFFEMLSKKELYFILGTHYRFPTYDYFVNIS
jgi:hypothetical protein